MIENVALHLQVRSTLDLDCPAVAQRCDQSLFDHSNLMARWVFDFHTILDVQHALLDLGQLPATAILENHRFAYAQSLAIHFVDLFAAVVFDPEIIADGYELLSHLIVGLLHTTTQRATAPLLALFSSTHNCSSFAFVCIVYVF